MPMPTSMSASPLAITCGWCNRFTVFALVPFHVAALLLFAVRLARESHAAQDQATAAPAVAATAPAAAAADPASLAAFTAIARTTWPMCSALFEYEFLTFFVLFPALLAWHALPWHRWTVARGMPSPPTCTGNSCGSCGDGARPTTVQQLALLVLALAQLALNVHVTLTLRRSTHHASPQQLEQLEEPEQQLATCGAASSFSLHLVRLVAFDLCFTSAAACSYLLRLAEQHLGMPAALDTLVDTLVDPIVDAVVVRVTSIAVRVRACARRRRRGGFLWRTSHPRRHENDGEGDESEDDGDDDGDEDETDSTEQQQPQQRRRALGVGASSAESNV